MEENKTPEVEIEKSESPDIKTNNTSKPKNKKKKTIAIIAVVLVIIFGIVLMTNEDIQNDINAGQEAADKYYDEYEEETEADTVEEETEAEKDEEDDANTGSYVTNTVEESDLSDLGAHFTFDAEEFIDMYNDLITEIGEVNDTDCSSLLLPELSEWIMTEDETVNGNYYKSYKVSAKIYDTNTIFSLNVDSEDKVTAIYHDDESLQTSLSFMQTILAVASGNGNVEMYSKIIDDMSENIGPSHYAIGNTVATINGSTVMVCATSDSVLEGLDPYYIK